MEPDLGLRQGLLRAGWRPLLNWVVILAGMLLYNGLTAVALIVVARRVPPGDYGQYVASYALVSFLVIIPGFGMDAWLLTRPQQERKATLALWWSAMRARFPLLAIWLPAMLLLTLLLPRETYPVALMLPTIIALTLDSVSLLCFASMRTDQRHWQVTLLQSASALALLGLALLLPVDEQYLLAFAVGRALLSAVIAGLAVVALAYPFQLAGAAIRPARDVLRDSRTFMVAELSSAVYVRADVTIVSLARGSSAAGIYGPAVSLLQLAFLPLRALFFFVVPVLSSAYQGLRRKQFVQYGFAQGVAQGLCGLALSLALFFLAPQIIRLVYGEAYAASAVILRILSPIPLLRAGNFGLAAMLTSSNRQHTRSRVQVAAAAFNVAANLLVVRPLGLPGVATIYVLSELLLLLGYAYLTMGAYRTLRLQGV